MGDRTPDEEWIPEEVRTQHHLLKSLFVRTREALAGGEREALEAVAVLREALDVHFAQEDALYYPTILALRPEHRAPLRACMEAHAGFRARLARLVESARAGPVAETRRILDGIEASFGQHEAAEERVLAALDREMDTLPH